jgi:hypothetical protein
MIYSKTEVEHVEHLNIVLKLLHQNSLFAKRRKCVFGQDIVEYLGHIITSEGVSTDSSKNQWCSSLAHSQDYNRDEGILGISRIL